MKIVFLLTHVPDPRTNRRIEVLKDQEIVVICVRRKSQDIWEPFFKEIKHEIINVDLPSSKHLLKRFALSQEYKRKALKLLTFYKPDIIYTEGLDSLDISCLYKKNHLSCKIIYEVADLRESYIEEPNSRYRKLLNNFIKKKEKELFTYVNNMAITSEKFFEKYYYRLISKERVVFIPNSPDIKVFKLYLKKKGKPFTIGFIGGIRYLKQMQMLVDASETVGCQVVFAGAGGTTNDYTSISKYCEGKKHVEFTGKYNYNNDIAKLYGKVDCVYAVYDASNANVRIALPNKLYEAVYCELPLIVAKNTYLSDIVISYGIGTAVNSDSLIELIEEIRKMMDNTYYSEFSSHFDKEKRELLDEKWKDKLINFCSGNK